MALNSTQKEDGVALSSQGVGALGSLGLLHQAGSIGLSAVGISTGLKVIGSCVGGGMFAGVGVLTAIPIVVGQGSRLLYRYHQSNTAKDCVGNNIVSNRAIRSAVPLAIVPDTRSACTSNGEYISSNKSYADVLNTYLASNPNHGLTEAKISDLAFEAWMQGVGVQDLIDNGVLPEEEQVEVEQNKVSTLYEKYNGKSTQQLIDIAHSQAVSLNIDVNEAIYMVFKEVHDLKKDGLAL
ncbi:hypothetical protein [Photobacterium leiognathi]|uniref:hypothetical protein n=1 Tax=Photobacterium leiognathi TaxID=553611 RepID=UPI002980D00F|nr:hypothetical protein [Photobacterium leiognathi]